MEIFACLDALKEELNVLEARQLVYWDACTHVTPNMGGERVTSSRNIRGNENNLNAYAEMVTKVQKKRKELEAAEAAAESILQAFEVSPGRTSERDAEILRLRYLRRLPWSDVQKVLHCEGYSASLRTITNWHLAAVQRLKAFLKKAGERK